MKKHSGSALMDYIVPTAVAGLVMGCALYYVASSGNIPAFMMASLNIQEDSIAGTGLMGTSAASGGGSVAAVQAGSLGGTPTKPQLNCGPSECSIDYGDFVLNGLPANYSQIVETVGASGGTEALVTQLDLILQQARDNDLPVDIKLLQELANLGHNVARQQEVAEALSNSANVNLYNQILTNMSELGSATNDFANLKETIYLTHDPPKNDTQRAIVEIVKALGDQIVFNSGQVLNAESTVMDYVDRELNGENIDKAELEQFVLENLKYPEHSKDTDLRSVVICATGNGADTGVHCD
jgi:hypothetical protein